MDSDETRPQILVVDDDRLIRSLVRETLEAEGYLVSEAVDGPTALAYIENKRPDLLMLDVAMPGMDGFEVCRALRDRYGKDSIPVLIGTSSLDRESIERAYEVGTSDFMTKPFHWPLLVHRVRHLIRESRNLYRVQHSKASLSNAQRIARVGSWEWNTETNEMEWSDEVFRILGVDPGTVEVGYDCFLFRVHPGDREFVEERIRQSLLMSVAFSVEHRMLRPDGDVRFVHQQGEFVTDDRRPGAWVSGTIQDVTEQRQAQDRIRYLANFDSLTGLANRRLFKERLDRMISQAAMNDTMVAVLFLDLDRFKRINDTLGHSAGDQLLRVVADRLRDRVRGSDVVGRPEGDDPDPPVSRLGGDEFTVLLSQISDPEDAGDVAKRILEALPEPITVDGHEIWTTASIGIAIYPMDGEDVESLLKHADTAMYHAKEQQRNSYHFFSKSMNAALVRKLSLESRLRDALRNEEFRLHYQPRIDLRTGRVIGMEALIRWEHPDLGVVSPREFIPVTEEAGLITEIGSWVLNKACAQTKAWQDAGHRRMCVSVNVSSRQFGYCDISDTVVKALRETGLDPHDLELEITEGVVIRDDDATAVMLRDLRTMGVRVALDDFGTGYSSLSYLTRFPLDTLKMDLAFIRDVATDPSAAGVVTGVIAMAHSLSLQVVAEGVDSEDQAKVLRDVDCDEVQGFLYAGALPPDEFLAYLKKHDAEAQG
jgi:diguanylate cyclase (GGDEF)-like protein/PAS domain S-box-containing protein